MKEVALAISSKKATEDVEETVKRNIDVHLYVREIA